MLSTLYDRVPPLVPSLVVVAGVLMPWVQVDPNHEGAVISIYYPGMGSGLELPHGIVLLLAVVVLSLLSLAGRRSRRGELVVGVGGALAVGWFIQGWQGTFIPAPGAWVTLAGCILLAGVGASRLVSAHRNTRAVT